MHDKQSYRAWHMSTFASSFEAEKIDVRAAGDGTSAHSVRARARLYERVPMSPRWSADRVGCRRRLAGRRDADAAPDPAQHRVHGFRRGRSVRPLEPMRIGDGGEPSADGRGLQARIGEVSEIGRRRRRARGERMRFRAFAPGLEILPIRSIRSPGRRGLFVGRVPCRRRREHQRCIVDAAGGKLGRRPVLRRPRARNSALYLHTAMCALNFGCGKSDYLR
jgi:hypothetical protein